MATVSVLNTDSGLSAKTVDLLESDQTITGAKTFDRDPSAPFIVTSGSAVVTNLDADKLDGQEGAAYVRVDGTNALTAGIKFPAAQNASADVNVLDDYEEGPDAWTPVLGGSGGTSGQTYSIQKGWYIKIGKLVVAGFKITLTAKGTITGSCQIQGLPFTVGSTTNQIFTNIVRHVALATNWVNVVASPNSGATTADVTGANAAAASNETALVTADIANATQMAGTIIYIASA